MTHEAVDDVLVREDGAAIMSRSSDEDPSDPRALGLEKQCVGDACADEAHHAAAERFRQPQIALQQGSNLWRRWRVMGVFNRSRNPLGAQPASDALGLTKQSLGLRPRSHGHKNPLGDAPGIAAGAAGRFHVAIGTLGHPAERQFTEFKQMGAFEEPLHGPRGDIWQVDFSSLEPVEQFVRWQINQLDFVGTVEHVVGNRFLYPYAGRLLDQIDEALHMLHVQRGVDVDPGGHQIEDILPAFWMEQAGGIGVRHLIQEQHLRLAGDGTCQIEFMQSVAPVGNRQSRKHLEPSYQGCGFRASMRFHDADDNIGACRGEPAGRLQHCIGFAHSGRKAEEHLQVTAGGLRLIGMNGGEQRVGVGPG